MLTLLRYGLLVIVCGVIRCHSNGNYISGFFFAVCISSWIVNCMHFFLPLLPSASTPCHYMSILFPGCRQMLWWQDVWSSPTPVQQCLQLCPFGHHSSPSGRIPGRCGLGQEGQQHKNLERGESVTEMVKCVSRGYQIFSPWWPILRYSPPTIV